MKLVNYKKKIGSKILGVSPEGVTLLDNVLANLKSFFISIYTYLEKKQ